jgi:hypothetical protein
MARTSTAASPAKETKPRRSTAVPTERKRTPVRKKSEIAAPGLEFDPAAHYDEIAASAYLNFLARAGAPGTPEEDWVLAEATVRARYTS